MRFSAFTWNMQRGSSITTDKKLINEKSAARKKVLELLCKHYAVGFITEAGKDLFNAVSTVNPTSALLPEGVGYWYCSDRKDGQAGKNDCKSLLFARGILKPVEVNFKSGKETSFRYPAAAVWESAQGPRVLFAAVHATSGGGGWGNSSGLFDHFDESGKGPMNCHVAIIGGDMNSNHSYFHMPDGVTHQSGHTLDGFMHESYFGSDDYYVVTVEKPQAFVIPGRYELRKDGSELGYFVIENGVASRASDHAPVVTTISIERATFNIGSITPKSRRARQPKPNRKYR